MEGDVDDVIREVRAEFDTTMSHLSTKGPEVSKENTYFFLAYFGERIGLQLEVSLPYFSIAPMLFRPTQSRELPVAFWDASGRVIVLHLHEALEKLGLDYVELPEVRKLSGQHGDSKKLAWTLARVVEKHWDAMSRRADEFLPL